MPNAAVITTKHGLVKTLRALERVAVQRGRERTRDKLRAGDSAPSVEAGEAGEAGEAPGLLPTDSFVPPTYLINLCTDKLQLAQRLQSQVRQNIPH